MSNDLDLEHLLDVAAAVSGLGPLSLVADLGGSPRSLVGRVTDGTETYVVKVVGLEEDDTWAREASALGAAEGSGVAPRLLGADKTTQLIVMSDLGTTPPVSDHLMSGPPGPADAGLMAWARAVARLHADGAARAERYTELLAGQAPGEPAHAMPATLDRAATAMAAHATTLGITGTEAALRRLRELPDHFATPGVVLSPGDACPDNNVMDDDSGVVLLLDFEFAEARHRAWDLAYLTVPWPTCWCSWQLPVQSRDAAVAAYLADSGLEGDASFEHDLALATQGWCLATAARLLDPALVGDEWDVPEMPSPRLRAAHRLENAVRSEADPLLTSLASEVLTRIRERWRQQPLPLAPAYRS